MTTSFDSSPHAPTIDPLTLVSLPVNWHAQSPVASHGRCALTRHHFPWSKSWNWENTAARHREASVKYFSEVTRSDARNKEAQFRNNQINFLRCCLISWESWMARRAAGVYHAIQSRSLPRPSPSTEPIIIKVKTLHQSNFDSSLLPLLLLQTLFSLIDFALTNHQSPTNFLFLFQVNIV